MKKFTCGLSIVLALVCAAAWVDPACAANDTLDEQRAKQATPASGKALLYVYRGQDGGATPITVSVNGKDVASLAPLTFGVWNVPPGRLVLKAAGKTLTLQPEAGRIYFVELSYSPIETSLRPVSYAAGRQQVQRARLAGKDAPPAPAASPVLRRAAEKNKFSLSLKYASVKLARSTQDILGEDQRIDDGTTSFGLEAEAFFNPNFSVSVEFMRYGNDFRGEVSGDDGKVSTNVYLGNLNYYFRDAGESLRPYVSVGLGAAATDFEGAITGGTSGVALQAGAGLRWRVHEKVSLGVQYKIVQADTEDDEGEGVDVSMSGLFASVALHF